jgi:hypothetical protein
MSDNLDQETLDQLHAALKEAKATHISIPIGQYETLMAAVKAAETYYRGYAQDEADEEGICGKAQQDAARELRDSLAALRAAGIDLEEKT